MADITGKRIIITGAARGIGRATAVELAKLGACVGLSDLDESDLLDAVAECESVSDPFKQQHMAYTLDVSSFDGCDRFATAFVDKYKSIDHVFNCAGINPTKTGIESTTKEYWQKLIDVNLSGTFAMTRACVPHMKEGSSIVNMASTCGIYPTAELSAYCATKHAVVGFSKCLALELGPKGIRVNIVAPGTINTPSNVSVRAGAAEMESMSSTIALRRFGTASEVAKVVVFLFSSDSQYMNGSVVEINGGIGVAG
ncbi:NAD(P)-binding protein [Annulohypoxylon moriforme]|nr:NAD(P)-binding protein [Annulohypoxylon moriforme]